MLSIKSAVNQNGITRDQKLSGVTEALNYNDSREPVEVSALPRELKPLGQALNKMHQALVKDFERLSQFADDPLMNLERPLMHYWVRIRLRSVKPEVSLNIKKQLPVTLKSWKIFRG